MNKVMQDKLSGLGYQVKDEPRKSYPPKKEHKPRPYDEPYEMYTEVPYTKKGINVHTLQADGVDHINIGSNVATDLGELLDCDSDLPLHHSEFGRFSSVKSFWEYILTDPKDDAIRSLRAGALKRHARTRRLRLPNMKAIVADAMWQRITEPKNDPLARAMRDTTAPFTKYFVNYAGIRINNDYDNWILAALEEIRSALKEERVADFTFLRDISGIDLYEPIKNTMKIDAPAPRKSRNAILDKIQPKPKKHHEKSTRKKVETPTPETPVVDVTQPVLEAGDEQHYETETLPDVPETIEVPEQGSQETVDPSVEALATECAQECSTDCSDATCSCEQQTE
jgi:hypothetical protein